MKLPNHHQATIARSKVVLYLLNDAHPKGKSKAKFFKRFGFTIEQWEVLANALKRHAADHEIATSVETDKSIQYTIEGVLVTPDGRNPFIRSVWATDHGDVSPHFVTAYPVEEE